MSFYLMDYRTNKCMEGLLNSTKPCKYYFFLKTKYHIKIDMLEYVLVVINLFYLDWKYMKKSFKNNEICRICFINHFLKT